MMARRVFKAAPELIEWIRALDAGPDGFTVGGKRLDVDRTLAANRTFTLHQET